MGLLRFSYRSDIEPSYKHYGHIAIRRTDVLSIDGYKKRRRGCCKKKVGIPGRNEIPDGISASWWRG